MQNQDEQDLEWLPSPWLLSQWRLLSHFLILPITLRIRFRAYDVVLGHDNETY